ncbi:glycosyltransferase family 1 [Opitutaceae bacterium TAV5]|nr:glycosyltransferase family 1 [Opitutaceae bacterium TAV5]
MKTHRQPNLRRAVVVAFFALTAAFAHDSRAALIAGDNFDTYENGRLQTVSGGTSVWTSSTTTLVASATGVAHSGTKYVELGTTAAEISASRTFSGVPVTGTYWVQFSVQANFTNTDLNSTNRPQIRFGDGTNNIVTILFRDDLDVFRVAYVPTVGDATTNIDTRTASIGTDIKYTDNQWHTFTFGIDLTNQTASIYLDGQTVISSFTFSGYGTTFRKFDIRSLIPTSASDGSSLRIDSIGFYDTNPLSTVPEASTWAAFAGLVALALGLFARRHRRA